MEYLVIFFFWILSVVGGSIFIVESKLFGYIKDYFLGNEEKKTEGILPKNKVHLLLSTLTNCYQCSGSQIAGTTTFFLLISYFLLNMKNEPFTFLHFLTGFVFWIMSYLAGGYISMVGVALLNYLDNVKK